MFGISFATRGLYGGVEWIWTWNNYSRLVDPLYGYIYFRSVLFAGMTTLVCLILGFPLAYSIARAPQRWQPLLFILILIPFWTNFLVRTYAWFFILRADGLINSLLLGMGFISEPLEILYTDLAVFIGLVYGYLPFMVVPLVIVIERIPRRLEEAGKGLVCHGLVNGLASDPALIEARNHWGMCLGLHPHAWGVHYSLFIGRRAKYVVGDVDSSGVSRYSGLALWRRDILCSDGNGVTGHIGHEKTRGNGWPVMIKPRWILLMSSVGIMLFLYAPVFLLIVFSFNASPMSIKWEGLSFEWYRQLLADRALVEATLNSLFIAVISTVFAVLMGTGAAMVLERQSCQGSEIPECRFGSSLGYPRNINGRLFTLVFCHDTGATWIDHGDDWPYCF